MRGPAESYSDVILWRAQIEANREILKRRLADAEAGAARETGQVYLAGRGRGDIRAKP